MGDESGAWLTYQEVGERLGITPEAASEIVFSSMFPRGQAARAVRD